MQGGGVSLILGINWAAYAAPFFVPSGHVKKADRQTPDLPPGAILAPKPLEGANLPNHEIVIICDDM
jgi:hypothetical protein